MPGYRVMCWAGQTKIFVGSVEEIWSDGKTEAEALANAILKWLESEKK